MIGGRHEGPSLLDDDYIMNLLGVPIYIILNLFVETIMRVFMEYLLYVGRLQMHGLEKS